MSPNAVGSSLHEDLALAMAAVRIHSPTAFSFADGEVVETAGAPLPVQLPGHPVHPLSEHAVVRGVQAVLYRRCYSHHLSSPPPLAQQTLDESPDLVAALSAANRGTERWDNGWRIYALGSAGQVWVVKGDRQRSAMAGEYLLANAAFTPLAVGSLVSLHMPHESLTVQPGFLFMFGETPSDRWDEHYTVRYYLNVSAEGVASLVEYITEQLQRFEISYRMKALTDPKSYSRADAAVLYVARRDHPIVSRLLCVMPDCAAAGLDSAEPLFSKRIRPGIGLAEDPRSGESFGMHRCRLVAEGILDAFHLGQHDLASKARCVARRFRRNGLDLDRPYLNPGSRDIYETADQKGSP